MIARAINTVRTSAPASTFNSAPELQRGIENELVKGGMEAPQAQRAAQAVVSHPAVQQEFAQIGTARISQGSNEQPSLVGMQRATPEETTVALQRSQAPEISTPETAPMIARAINTVRTSAPASTFNSAPELQRGIENELVKGGMEAPQAQRAAQAVVSHPAVQQEFAQIGTARMSATLKTQIAPQVVMGLQQASKDQIVGLLKDNDINTADAIAVADGLHLMREDRDVTAATYSSTDNVISALIKHEVPERVAKSVVNNTNIQQRFAQITRPTGFDRNQVISQEKISRPEVLDRLRKDADLTSDEIGLVQNTIVRLGGTAGGQLTINNIGTSLGIGDISKPGQPKIQISEVKIAKVMDIFDAEMGGIDFRAKSIHLEIKRDGKGVPIPLKLQDVENINIEGLYPVIINISPATFQNLPLMMGQKEKKAIPQLSKK